MRTTAPRKFDRALVESTTLEDLLEAMRHRYPHLTPEQHEWRYRIAIHEAGHLMTALVLYQENRDAEFGTYAYVRVPKRNPKTNQAGTEGEVSARGISSRARAMSGAGGIVADVLTFGPVMAKGQLKQGNYDDDADRIKEYVKRRGETTGRTSKVETLQLLRGARDVIRSSRVPLEKLAIALLLHGDSAGVIRYKQWGGLLGYYLPRC